MQQIPAIIYANHAGYQTILCDYLSDNPGQYYAKCFYLVSTTDMQAVKEVAIKEEIDGILAYASDPAALTAAYVGECLKLPTNPYHSVKILSHKDEFRTFQRNNGFACPKTYENDQDIDFPVIVKPIDSSGSKGVSKVIDKTQLEKAIDNALTNSKAKKVVIEQFIIRDHPFLVGGDCFILNGKVIYWGLLNCYRDQRVNQLVPAGKSYPLSLSDHRIELIKKEIQRAITLLGMMFGAINVEIMIDKDDNVYIIEIGPRNGGNMIPDFLKIIDKIDMVKASVEVAMGNTDITLEYEANFGYYVSYNIHSDQSGRLNDIVYDDLIKDKIISKVIYKNKGDHIEYFEQANQALGILFLKFDDQKTQLAFMNDPSKWVKVILDKE